MEYGHKQFLSDDHFILLSEVLNSIGGNKFSLTLSPGIEEGENFCGIIINAEVKWSEGENASISYLTMKVTPPSTLLHLLIPVKLCYQREIYLYSQVFPKFEAFQIEKNVFKHFKPYPTFYKTLKETHEMLVFENLKILGFRHRSRHQCLDYNHIIIVIKEYARLHALSLAMRDQKPILFEELAKNTADHLFTNYKQYKGVSMICEHRIGQALKSLDPVLDKVVYEKFSYFYNNLSSVLDKLIKEINPYAVISHIDTGIQNLLFNYEDQSDLPTDVSILDWQQSRLTSPAVDISTFIFSASDKTLRKNYDDIILEYYKTLSLFLKELGSDPEKLLPFKVLQEELKRFSIVGLYMVFGLIYIYSTTSQTVPDILNDDAHNEGFSFIYELQDRSTFDQRVRDCLIDFDRFGYNFW